MFLKSAKILHTLVWIWWTQKYMQTGIYSGVLEKYQDTSSEFLGIYLSRLCLICTVLWLKDIP